MSSIRDRIALAEAKIYVTAAELALLTGFSADTIRRAGKDGEIPTIQLRHSTRYPREEAIRIMRRRGYLPSEQQTQQGQQERRASTVST